VHTSTLAASCDTGCAGSQSHKTAHVRPRFLLHPPAGGLTPGFGSVCCMPRSGSVTLARCSAGKPLPSLLLQHGNARQLHPPLLCAPWLPKDANHMARDDGGCAGWRACSTCYQVAAARQHSDQAAARLAILQSSCVHGALAAPGRRVGQVRLRRDDDRQVRQRPPRSGPRVQRPLVVAAQAAQLRVQRHNVHLGVAGVRAPAGRRVRAQRRSRGATADRHRRCADMARRSGVTYLRQLLAADMWNDDSRQSWAESAGHRCALVGCWAGGPLVDVKLVLALHILLIRLQLLLMGRRR
jgi:hypothetical protein